MAIDDLFSEQQKYKQWIIENSILQKGFRKIIYSNKTKGHWNRHENKRNPRSRSLPINLFG
jgi:hypothetical protein